ncbi:probable phospholipid-transporting ATPase IH [Actinia tenebrosa]|uniref:Probable phospholipid-transporting ATPase IH n=1 Tax=Actinia tenebrosa TaxID=6105 RepID=A0A6P8H3W5_ACTTE|nr:probable phospholipid-transporting ATPase IH [Actinia tenebrosa]
MVGITMHQAAVILANLHLGLATSQWTWIHHLFLWGSMILSFAWTICFGLVQVTHKIYFVSIVTLSSKEFWSLCALISVTALLPRYSLLALRRTVCPTQIDEDQIQKRTKPRFNAAHKIDANGYNEEPKTQSSVVML